MTRSMSAVLSLHWALSAATVAEQTSTFRLVTMATGVASAGLSRCFNGACWWMTPLLYHSMLCHLQLHAALARSLPHPRMLLYCLHGRKLMCLKTTNKQIYLLQKYFLLIREALDSSERPGDEKSVVDRSDDEADILSEMASALCPEDPDHSTQAEKRSGSCSFIWLNRWSRAAMARSERRRVESSEVKPPQQTRYGPDRGAPPSSSCTLSEPH